MSQDARETILVVDDSRDNLQVVSALLHPTYRVRVCNSGARALQAVELAPIPDLILLDIMMPEMSGHEVMRALRQLPATRDIPVIFLTAMSADEDEEYGLSLGAVDYVTKPIRPAILMARLKAQLDLKRMRDRLQDQKLMLEDEVRARTSENELIKDVSLNALATLAEKRDNETGNHLFRTQHYVEMLMQRLQAHPDFAAELSRERQTLIAKATPLHDIGKVGIPDAILLKPGKLTPEEFEIMKQHSDIGADAIAESIARVLAHREAGAPDEGNGLAFLETAMQIARSHHEKWDGSGYPQGLAGEAIPLSARLMALADVFDALTCKRHYKAAFPEEEVRRILAEGRGTHFDPRIIDAFFADAELFFRTAQEQRDH